jgi:hypothetical protein
MIQKILKARSIADMLRYLLGPMDSAGRTRPRVEIIDSVFAGKSQREIAQEMRAIVRQRPKLQRNMFHSTLRLSPRDRGLSDETWRKLSRKYVEALGFDSHLTINHDDHVHILCPRIRINGSVVPDSHDYARGEAIVRTVEVEFGLERVNPSHLLDPSARAGHIRPPSPAERRERELTGLPAPTELIQSAILELLDKNERSSIDELSAGLKAREIEVVTRPSNQPDIPQVAFRFNGRLYGPRKLGGMFTAANLAKVGLSFRPKAIGTKPEAKGLPMPVKPSSNAIDQIEQPITPLDDPREEDFVEPTLPRPY